MKIDEDVYKVAKKWLFHAQILTILGSYKFLLTWVATFKVVASSGICEFSDKCMDVPTYWKLKKVYAEFGLKSRCPFNKSIDEYWIECAGSNCHLNLKRIAFVNHLIYLYESGRKNENPQWESSRSPATWVK